MTARQIDRKTKWQKDKLTKRQIDRKANIQSDTQISRQKDLNFGRSLKYGTTSSSLILEDDILCKNMKSKFVPELKEKDWLFIKFLC